MAVLRSSTRTKTHASAKKHTRTVRSPKVRAVPKPRARPVAKPKVKPIAKTVIKPLTRAIAKTIPHRLPTIPIAIYEKGAPELRKFHRRLVRDPICGDDMQTSYITKAFLRLEVFFVAEDKITGDIRGFLMLQFKDGGRTAYVDLICSNMKGVGSNLMQTMLLYIQSRPIKVTMLKLDSLPGAESFYRKGGFIESDNACAATPIIKRIGDDINGYRYTKCLSH